MFIQAIELASKFTFPLIISNRHQDNTVSSGLGAFVIINEEGWFITAAHILQQNDIHKTHLKEYKEFVNGSKMVINPKWVLNHSLWFGADHHQFEKYIILPENDLAIGKLRNFNPSFVESYPKFVNPALIKPGKTLCKLGFPFYDINATFINNTFRYDPQLFPIPRFPLDGMLTRIISNGKNPLWIETSTPGLKGQSGGPIFDTEGNIWGIQSLTKHIPLGFAPKIKKEEGEIEENQFINLSWGIHAGSIIQVLEQQKIKYYMDSAIS